MDSFRALVVDKADSDTRLSLAQWTPERLPAGEVTIRVEYSSVNYKDGLAVRADGRVVRNYPLIPGIDLAGEVIESTDSSVQVGSKVIVHGYDTGVAHHGGLSE